MVDADGCDACGVAGDYWNCSAHAEGCDTRERDRDGAAGRSAAGEFDAR
jgi:hypothetical protein